MTMSRFVQLFALLVLSVLPFAGRADATDTGLDIEYAEHVPLATHSLMLALARVGDRLVAAGERGHVILSDDEGASWRQAEAVPTRSTLTTLFVVDGRIWAAGHDSVILTSGDGGDTWTRQYFEPDRQQPVMGLYFRDPDHGIAVGAYGLMLITTDGGQSWEDWAVNEEDDAHLNAILGLPSGDLLIAGEAGHSYRSSDGGETWATLEMPYQGSMFGALRTEDNCVLFYGLRGHVLRSCDEGDNWQQLASGSEATLLGAAAQDGTVLFGGNSGVILIYSGVDTFSAQLHSSGVDFAAVLSLGSGRFLLAGEDGIHFYPENGGAVAGP
jgi:photosystem II stability/assembly factor-like uncharacterized protein